MNENEYTDHFHEGEDQELFYAGMTSSAAIYQQAPSVGQDVLHHHQHWNHLEQYGGCRATDFGFNEFGSIGESTVQCEPELSDDEPDLSRDREERRKYLEQHQALDFMTKALMLTDTTDGRTKQSIPFREAIKKEIYHPDQMEARIIQDECREESAKVENLKKEIRDLERQVQHLEASGESAEADDDAGN